MRNIRLQAHSSASVKMTDRVADDTSEASKVKSAWQEAQDAVDAQRDAIEGAKVRGICT